MPSTPLPTVGVLVPSTDTTLEQELPQLLSGRATVHFTRMDLPDVTPAGLAVMEQAAHAGIGLLAQIEPDVILFGCTSGSFFRGAAHETRLVADLSSRTDAPIITTARAMVRALSARGRRVRLRTPYTEEITTAEVSYLQDAGLTVASAASLGLIRDRDISRISPAQLLQHATGSDDADVLMLSCTNVPTLGTLTTIAAATGLPAVTSNLAASEAILAKLAGVNVG